MSKPLFLLIAAIATLVSALLGLVLAEYAVPLPQEMNAVQGFFHKAVNEFNLGVFIIFTLMPIVAAAAAWQHYYARSGRSSRRILLYRIGISLGLMLSITGFYLGLTMPIFSGTKFWIFSQDISVMKSIQMLFEMGELFLGILILLFTIIVPAVKYLFLLMGVFSQAAWVQKLCDLVGKIGKWSMLDVLVLAITIVFIKLHDNSMNISSKVGIIWFAIAVLSSMLLTIALQKLNKELIKTETSLSS